MMNRRKRTEDEDRLLKLLQGMKAQDGFTTWCEQMLHALNTSANNSNSSLDGKHTSFLSYFTISYFTFLYAFLAICVFCVLVCYYFLCDFYVSLPRALSLSLSGNYCGISEGGGVAVRGTGLYPLLSR